MASWQAPAPGLQWFGCFLFALEACLPLPSLASPAPLCPMARVWINTAEATRGGGGHVLQKPTGQHHGTEPSTQRS